MKVRNTAWAVEGRISLIHQHIHLKHGKERRPRTLDQGTVFVSSSLGGKAQWMPNCPIYQTQLPNKQRLVSNTDLPATAPGPEGHDTPRDVKPDSTLCRTTFTPMWFHLTHPSKSSPLNKYDSLGNGRIQLLLFHLLQMLSINSVLSPILLRALSGCTLTDNGIWTAQSCNKCHPSTQELF